ncbi:hypothetical protein OF820_00695 [Oceanotoga sp. DSM 15011]|jgi:hypothetical protein|uniref:hypothetical protein n=1 Tax=Oceanotoga sp. DSM 15011 TaxID=2984951 RepID=UPI0021F4A768|nr:hypothetical protein [Oceanotoga sp. DSM 15011]UYP00215.1 hypothetical protein OF820_00695 [Oceanotoga sp. DSM 15011]
MKKVFFSIFLIIVSLSFSSYNINLSNIPSTSDDFYFNIGIGSEDLKDINAKVSFNDLHRSFITQKIFFREVKIKTGERLFSAFLNIPIYNSNFVFGYEMRSSNDLLGIIKSNSFSRTEVFTGGFHEYSYSFNKVLVPGYFKGGLSLISFDEINSYRFDGYSDKYFKLPITLGFRNDTFVSGIKIDTLDKYYTNFLGIGFGINNLNIYPYIFSYYGFEFLNHDFEFSLNAVFKEPLDYEIYLVDKDFDLPLIIYFSSNGGGIFFEL